MKRKKLYGIFFDGIFIDTVFGGSEQLSTAVLTLHSKPSTLNNH